MRHIAIRAILSIILVSSISAEAKFAPEISVYLGNEIIDGFTQYEIKFTILSDGYFQAYGNSRLKFPFNNYFSGGILEVGYGGLSVNVGIWQDYKASMNEKMEDFDWISSTDDDYIQLAYGITTPTTSMNYYELNVRYDFDFSKIKIGPFLKYSKHHLEFIANDLEQYWYVDLETGDEIDPPDFATVPGTVLYYEQDLKLPILGINFEYKSLWNKIDLFTSVGISPFTGVDDYDDHVIRHDSLESRSSGGGGNGFLFEIGSRINVINNFWLSANYSYTDFSIDALTTQRYIDEEMDKWITVIGINSQVRGLMRKMKVTISYLFDI